MACFVYPHIATTSFFLTTLSFSIFLSFLPLSSLWPDSLTSSSFLFSPLVNTAWPAHIRTRGPATSAGQCHAGCDRHVPADGGDGEAGSTPRPGRGEGPLLHFHWLPSACCGKEIEENARWCSGGGLYWNVTFCRKSHGRHGDQNHIRLIVLLIYIFPEWRDCNARRDHSPPGHHWWPHCANNRSSQTAPC